ncbi:MAG: hypothetical protein PWR30_270 [Candidatus Woesearchaeota archaeon]|nr:hypothetical protein [Candidatus Woesearchaeota archaeon]
MFEGKRSQAAMEFLMTYGWAIMVVLLALGALAYFGVLNPENLLPERCTFPVGFQCADHSVDPTANEVRFRIVNGKGSGVIIYNLSITDSEGNFQGCTLDFTTATACENTEIQGSSTKYCGDQDTLEGYNDKTGLYMSSSDIAVVTIPCTEVADYESKARADVHITWYYADSTTAFTHTETGELFALAQ